ncbi:MAG TPA: polyprenyl diphosphate synthase [Oscillospiraceae bacterium]|nr:polyprenyl diphosphate synthase [Oscillospiraceae bacterium]HQQ89688.1 polyprenyl diphosphate synthase [Oscillospiraceae bacterium]HRW56465.1 polyprenyl diphosphate synthase [Oscillospiraceae bacterium]
MKSERILPAHIGIIMDGNGRWAKKKGLPRSAGHKKGAEVFETIARYCRDIGIRYLTVYAFSTENWRRPKQEVEDVMDLMRSYLRRMDSMTKEHIAIRFIGDRVPLADDLRALMEKAEKAKVSDVKLTVQIALNYGGRDEILHAVQAIANKVRAGGLAPEEITEELISANLYSVVPDADLILRPSGEERLSNFLLWESAYSELIFMDVLWPDFTPAHLEKALAEYAGRDRRFGGV